ncbi:MAG: LLM class flavin-dependent oxidoreductase [Candidatus Thorarchaeota archaeon]
MELSFGLQLEPQFGYTISEMDSIAEQLEETRFDTVWVSDHMFLDNDSVERCAFDCFTLMTYLVSKYSKLRVGSLVLCNSYRQPGILAKMVTSLDHFSGGRLELGYGAGWKEIEYTAYGIPFPSARVRISQFEEAIQVLKALWQEDKATFSGNYYTLKEAICSPKPFQKPHPRLWIGTMTGGRRMLRVTAKYGDGINVAWSFGPKKCTELFSQLEKYCSEFGRPARDVLRSIGSWVRYFKNKGEMESRMKEEASKRNLSYEQYKDRVKGALVGTKDMIIEKLIAYKNLGVSHFILMFPMKEELQYLVRFNDEILPEVL